MHVLRSKNTSPPTCYTRIFFHISISSRTNVVSKQPPKPPGSRRHRWFRVSGWSPVSSEIHRVDRPRAVSRAPRTSASSFASLRASLRKGCGARDAQRIPPSKRIQKDPKDRKKPGCGAAGTHAASAHKPRQSYQLLTQKFDAWYPILSESLAHDPSTISSLLRRSTRRSTRANPPCSRGLWVRRSDRSTGDGDPRCDPTRGFPISRAGHPGGQAAVFPIKEIQAAFPNKGQQSEVSAFRISCMAWFFLNVKPVKCLFHRRNMRGSPDRPCERTTYVGGSNGSITSPESPGMIPPAQHFGRTVKRKGPFLADGRMSVSARASQ